MGIRTRVHCAEVAGSAELVCEGEAVLLPIYSTSVHQISVQYHNSAEITHLYLFPYDQLG